MGVDLSRAARTALFKALRLAFRLTPMPQATRDRLRARFLDGYASLVPPAPRGQLAGGGSQRRAHVRADERAIGYVPHARAGLPDPLPATLVAFYLPQFHAIAENDAWWGKGFTEWRNVARALPQFEGHAQPRLPGELGFYDLGDVGTMREQARLAREYGIGAFCFYFYWFGGRTLLETPLRQWLAETSIDFPFCLCWANENWSRTWDGRGQDVLIAQAHSPEDDLAFIAHVADYLRDPRCLRVEGKPMLLVYRPGLLPDAPATAARWRHWCREHRIGEVHLAYVQSFDQVDPRTLGFDSCVQFPPNLSSPPSLAAEQVLVNPAYEGQVLDWREMARAFAHAAPVPYWRHPGVNCGWDNEARRPGRGRTFLHASPRGYRDWLRSAIATLPTDRPLADRLVFVNAWNEWAEGAVLEPDAVLGHAWLDAGRRALVAAGGVATAQSPCLVVHAWHLPEFAEILDAVHASGIGFRVIVTTVEAHAREVEAMLQDSPLRTELVVGENRGRDILPFLRACQRLADEDVEVVLKLHTKRSPHLPDGDQWRREMLAALLEPQAAANAMAAFATRPRLGLVAPAGHLLAVQRFIGANAPGLDYVRRRTGVAAHEGMRDARFPSGSMFWARLPALRPLLDTDWRAGEFEPELGQSDATLAHAIERAFGLVVAHGGFDVASTATLSGHPEPEPGRYRYARDSSL